MKLVALKYDVVLSCWFHIDIDECDGQVCNMHANCSNTIGSYMCQCDAGFTGNGENCTGWSDTYAGRHHSS